jgi:hypothetical protein
VRAERRAGQLLKETEKAKGSAGQGRPKKGGSAKTPPKKAPTLADIGVTKTQSSRWQKLADRSEKDWSMAPQSVCHLLVSVRSGAERARVEGVLLRIG